MTVHSQDLAIHRLLEKQPLEVQAVDEFMWERVTPVVEGSAVTFLYRGEADSVHLRPFARGLGWERAFHRAEGSDLWYVMNEAPPGARVEYKLEVAAHGENRWIEDPLNPLRAFDPFGANSVLRATGYEFPEWAEHDPGARAGHLEEKTLRSRVLHRNVRVTMYFPAGFDGSGDYPLLAVHDGGDFLQYSAIKTIFDNLIHRGEIEALVVALVHPAERLYEYSANPNHARFLADELFPRLQRRYHLRNRPEGRGLMGASLGAVASLHAARSNPGFYGRILAQSGSFVFSGIAPGPLDPVFDPIMRFVDTYRRHPTSVAERVYVSCGTYEPLIAVNRPLVPQLQSTGMEVLFTEAPDGHHWENWRDRLREGLSFLFPGPHRVV